MPRWYHQCNGNELGQTSGDGEGQRCLVCCSPWGHKESDTTGQLIKKQETINEFFFFSFGVKVCCKYPVVNILR